MTVIDYAAAYGYSSLVAAIIFAVAYVPLCAFFIVQCFRALTYVYIVLTVFCTIRVGAFVIRAIMIGSDTSGDSLDLLVTDQILFSIGFFGLLNAAYTLVLDRDLLRKTLPSENPISRIFRNRRLFHIIMIVAVALGVYGITSSMHNPTSSVASTCRKASVLIFLGLTIVQAFLTIASINKEIQDGYRPMQASSLGDRYGSFILCAISLLLLVREAFMVATITNSQKEADEHFWYPLVALPEILAIMLYCTPGLVPPRSKLPQ
ncbi:uncharacterized protein BT62DRAFT_948923 [Guyanagaster necrorhizus]|uniref:DUF7702 domain-containing protein n=1 Tax=Guyanagaster necrorhizus TaxID=856835 RepID=A0A9P7VUD8_9AGAR|nr:uncharacterized protein BT62DRAFT_948923 [Guyanagaster necrorhizus MCA 3950]KAG7447047.1 hypothetical protein BT62DRAFT_948923 [Guyanagaster necrorhizus MCA 3950]